MNAKPVEQSFGAKNVLVGAWAYAADGLRHLLALVAAFTIISVLLYGGEILTEWSVTIVLRWLWGVASLALATLLGHVAVTRLRGFVSLPMSAFCTWLVLIVISWLLMLRDNNALLGEGADALALNLFLAVLATLPVVFVAVGLRLHVPPLRVHMHGRPVRILMAPDLKLERRSLRQER